MADEPEVEAVFWDIGGVILDIDSVQAAHAAFVERLVEAFVTEQSADEALETWRTTVGEYFREREGTEFRPAREAYRRAVDAIIDEPISEAAWRPLFRATLEEHARSNPDAIAAIEALADASVHQGVVSDVDDEEGRWLLWQFGVLDHVDAVTTSEAVGRTKPDPAMYEAALEKAGVEPSAAVMIGDRYEHDMAGAADLGFRTVAYGAEDGPAVTYRLEDLRKLPEVLGIVTE